MIKIQSSYKIIKNTDINSDNESSIAIQSSFKKRGDIFITSGNKTKYDDLISLDSIKEEIRSKSNEELKKEIYLEIEDERIKILNDAKEESRILLEEAKNEGLEIGLKEGYTNGYKKGIEEAKAEALKIKENAVKIVNEAHDYVRDYYIKSHDDIIRLAADMAESIVHTSINESSDNILMLIKPIMQQFYKTESIIITCHPSSFDYLKLYQYKLEEMCPNTTFTLLKDENMEEHGCILENENQILDLQIKEQIKSILDSINDLENSE